MKPLDTLAATLTPVFSITLFFTLAPIASAALPLEINGAGKTCNVEFALVDAVTLGSLQFDVDYTAAPGEFVGSGPDIRNGGTLQCVSMVSGALGAFSDNDAERLLTAGIVKNSGFTGPITLATCVFTPNEGVDLGTDDLAITVTDAKDTNVQPVQPLPAVEVSAIECTDCGNGAVSGAEDCDDGNQNDGDGCSSDCQIEDGWECSETGCHEICGDARLVGAEMCDDANTAANDGCSPVCGIEAGWNCTEPPSVCDELCGDGFVVGTEQCDDGNTQWGQGEACATDCSLFDCCDPDGSRTVTASDALLVLLRAVGARESCDRCLCDAIQTGGTTPVTAVDALACLRAAVHVPVQLACPACSRSTLAMPVLEGIADVAAADMWGPDVARGEPVPTLDLAGNVVSYLFPYARNGASAPTEQAIFDAVAAARALYDRSDPQLYEDLTNRIGEVGAVQVAASSSNFPVMAVLNGLPAYYLFRDEAQSKAEGLLGDDNASLEGLVFLGPHEEYFKFTSGTQELLLHTYTVLPRDTLQPLAGSNAMTAGDMQAFSPEVAQRRNAAWQEMAQRAAFPRIPRSSQTVIRIPVPERVPIIDWTCWCVPTAQSMVVGYWDHYSSGGTMAGFGRAFDFWYEDGCSQNVPNFLHELVELLNPSECPAGCNWSQAGGVQGILNGINGYNVTWSEVEGTQSNDWGWTALKAEIDAGRPAVWGVGPQEAHALTAIGYRIVDSQKFVITYNTWGVTAAQQLAEYSYDQWAGAPIKDSGIGRLVMGGGDTGNQAVLLFPRGQQELVGPQEIKWQVWGTTIKKTTIMFSSNGGKTWSSIASNVPTTQGTNTYQWTPSTNTAKGRITIDTFSSTGTYVAGDGSYQNFVVGAHADLVPVQAPTGGYCQLNDQDQLLIKVKNQGSGDAPSSTTRVYIPSLNAAWDLSTPAIAAGETATLAFTMPNACFNPDCDFQIEVDVSNSVPEVNETNNNVQGVCVS